MNVLTCTDLDQTLIYSRRAAGVVAADELVVIEHHDGEPASYLTRAAAASLRALDAACHWVPTTTRTPAQYARVRLPRGARPGRDLALCANGGVLLVDGVPDPAWATEVARMIARSAPLAEVEAGLARRLVTLPPHAAGPIRDAAGLFRYVVVDRQAVDPGWLAELDDWCTSLGWRTSMQGRKVYCLPAGLTKAAGAAEVARRIGATHLIAAGDSLLDIDLLLAADVAVRPAHGELADAGWRADHVSVTTTTGAAAGEDIAHWLLAAARRAASIPRGTP